MASFNKFKIRLWKLIYPIFLPVRDTLLKLGMISHSGRQPFLIGKLAPGKKAADLQKYMENQGFHRHFVAWNDDNQELSMRRLIGLEHQYHLRLFKDEEIRGHYEFTPESRPLQHYFDNGIRPKTEDFLHFLGDFVIPAPSVMDALKRIQEKEARKKLSRSS